MAVLQCGGDKTIILNINNLAEAVLVLLNLLCGSRTHNVDSENRRDSRDFWLYHVAVFC